MVSGIFLYGIVAQICLGWTPLILFQDLKDSARLCDISSSVTANAWKEQSDYGKMYIHFLSKLIVTNNIVLSQCTVSVKAFQQRT